MTEYEEGGDGLRDRLSAKGTDAFGDVAQVLLENPILSQVLQAAFGAREVAHQATSQAMRNLNLPTTAEVERLERRVRALSDRLESVEDVVDGLSRELAALRQRPPVSR